MIRGRGENTCLSVVSSCVQFDILHVARKAQAVIFDDVSENRGRTTLQAERCEEAHLSHLS